MITGDIGDDPAEDDREFCPDPIPLSDPVLTGFRWSNPDLTWPAPRSVVDTLLVLLLFLMVLLQEIIQWILPNL